jgi:hypothetical protein
MKAFLTASLAGLLALGSVASAGRDDRHYPSGGGDRYDRQRYEASIRYERGSRNHERTYVRYGQDNYIRRPSYDRDYVRRIDRGAYYVNGRAQRSNWGFSFGYSSRHGYAGDGVSLGLYYSNRPSVRYRYPGYSYHRAPDVYERRVLTYDECSPSVYEYREYRSSPGYYYRESASGWSSYSRSYYSR